jgi:hypothetical protein
MGYTAKAHKSFSRRFLHGVEKRGDGSSQRG